MAVWRFSDGTTVTSEGMVTGESEIAAILRDYFGALDEGFPFSVSVATEPGGRVRFRRGSDWLLNVLTRNLAARYEVAVTTDYLPRPEDIPEDARRLIERDKRRAAMPRPKGFVVY